MQCICTYAKVSWDRTEVKRKVTEGTYWVRCQRKDFFASKQYIQRFKTYFGIALETKSDNFQEMDITSRLGNLNHQRWSEVKKNDDGTLRLIEEEFIPNVSKYKAQCLDEFMSFIQVFMFLFTVTNSNTPHIEKLFIKS